MGYGVTNVAYGGGGIGAIGGEAHSKSQIVSNLVSKLAESSEAAGGQAIALRLDVIAGVGAIVSIILMIASLGSLFKVFRVDPAIVFRG